MYIKKIWDLGRVRMVEKHYPGNYGAPGMKRGERKKKTPEDVARQNRTNRVKKVQRLILANFKEGDWHLILGYRKGERPASFEAAKDLLQKFLGKMRAAFKRAGVPFKWIAVTERGKRGGCHHHLIIEDREDLDVKALVMKHWPHGYRTFSPLYEDGDFEDLAEYITKEETKEEEQGCSYSRSRNLIVPEPKKEVIHSRRWRREPKPEKGWYIVKDSLVNGINPVTGYPYQHYTMKQARGRGGGRDA